MGQLNRNAQGVDLAENGENFQIWGVVIRSTLFLRLKNSFCGPPQKDGSLRNFEVQISYYRQKVLDKPIFLFQIFFLYFCLCVCCHRKGNAGQKRRKDKDKNVRYSGAVCANPPKGPMMTPKLRQSYWSQPILQPNHNSPLSNRGDRTNPHFQIAYKSCPFLPTFLP